MSTSGRDLGLYGAGNPWIAGASLDVAARCDSSWPGPCLRYQPHGHKAYDISAGITGERAVSRPARVLKCTLRETQRLADLN